MIKDRFSDKASGYATFRPSYPESLYNFIYSQVQHFDVAWDAGTGNGQVATVLATRFNKVYATDISIRQLMKIPSLPNLSSFVADEFAPQIPENSVDLVTAAQAVHWFDADKFCQEITRVAKPGALLAIWGYGLIQLPGPFQHELEQFYNHEVGPYWDEERKHIDSLYKDIPISFEELPVSEAFYIDAEWERTHLEGYLGTWSATGNYIKEKSVNPVPDLLARLVKLGLPEKFNVNFPLFIRLFRI